VLAGGAGRRIGTPKALLAHPDGGTFLSHLLRTLGPVATERLVVAPAPVAARLGPLEGARLALDPGEGPARALLAASAVAEARWLLAVAVDHPRPSPALVARLLAAAGPAHEAVGIEADNLALEPLFALYARAALRRLARAADPPRSLRALLERLTDRAVLARAALPPGERAALVDVDTPADLAALGNAPCADLARSGR
jgi:molybdopterin-guanine dinucleotide biosynthesis protein A